MTALEIIGAIGGSAGIVALVKVGIDVFQAKSKKTSVDIDNMKEMLEEAHKMFDKATERYNGLVDKFDAYKEEVDKREEENNAKITKILAKVNKLERTVTQAYRCKYPQNILDCPVISEYEKKHLCADCTNLNENESCK